MDDYFTLLNVIVKLRQMEIGVVDTSRFRWNWLPKVLKNVEEKAAKFYDFFA